MNWVTEMFKKTAAKCGATIFIEPEYGHAGYIVFPKKRIFFRSERFNINNAGSIESVVDKNYCHFFLKHFGYKVPEGRTFFSDLINDQVERKRTIDDGYVYARSLGWPVMLKPNNGSKGRLVVKAENKSDYYQFARKILKSTQVFIVERHYAGDDCRIIVFNNKVFAAYKRKPFTIVGTGTKTISHLLTEAKRKVETSGNGKLDKERINATLQKLKRKLTQIPEKGEELILMQNANVSSGGQMEDITPLLHPHFRKIAVRMAKDLNLVLCGIDIICQDITKADKDYVILEINSAPALRHYASIGRSQLLRTESLYVKIFSHLQKS